MDVTANIDQLGPDELANLILKLVSDEEEVALEDLAANEGLPSSMLPLLVEHGLRLEYGGVLAAAAQNRQTPAEILRRLAELESVQWHVTENSNCPEDVLIALAGSDDPEVRYNVSDNRAISPESLRLLARDQRGDVREVAAMHIHTPAETLMELAMDPNAAVRNAVRSNETATDEIRATAAIGGAEPANS